MKPIHHLHSIVHAIPRNLKILGFLGLALAAMISPARAQTYSLSNTWAVVGVTQNLDAGADNRGMTYYAPSNIVIVNNKSTHLMEAYDGATGASNGAVNNTGLSGGTFTLNKMGVSGGNILYGANLQTAASGSAPYKVYSWTNLGVAPYVAYLGNGSDALGTFLSGGARRIGDTFAVAGSGTNTLILAGMGGTNAYALLYTTDGINFNSAVVTVPISQMPQQGSGVQFGIAFYTNNTFMVNLNTGTAAGSSQLYLIQFPANFASLTSPIIATVLATNSGAAGGWLDLSYNASAGLLATHGNASSPITLFSLPSSNFLGLGSLAATNLSFTTTQTINGNESGDVALGGVGLTNAIYTLDTSAGVQATAISFTAAAIAPTITTSPVGGSVFTNANTFSFSVAASGTLPLVYHWQYNTVSNVATASNIPGATNASFVISPLSVTNTGWYDVLISNSGGSTSSVPVLLTVTVPVSNPVVSNLWAIAPGTAGYPYLDSSSFDTRGLAYDTNTKSVLVCDKGAQLGIFVLDADNGTNKFPLNTVGIGATGNQFPMDQVGVGDDGVVYACNLIDNNDSVPGVFSVFSWPACSPDALPYQAYGPADPANGQSSQLDRWGDTMAVRGAGTNTQILLGSYFGFASGNSTNCALLTTQDGQNFTSLLLNITDAAGVPAGFSSLGVAFGAGNTFWTKSPGFDLRQIAFDPVTGNCTVLQDISTAVNGAAAFSSMSAICLDVPNNLLAGITFNDIPNDLSIFVLGTTNNAPPYLFDQAFFPSNNGNSQDNGVTTIKYPRIYSLDVNNGIVAYSYSVPLLPFSITSVSNVPGASVTLTWQSTPNRIYQVQVVSKLSKTGGWSNLGAPIMATGSTTSYTDTSTNATSAASYYQVAGH